MPSGTRLLAAVLGSALGLAAPNPAAAAEDYQQVIDLTFPTDPEATYTDSYDDPRPGGRMHLATDLMGQKGWEIFAAVGGTVCQITGVDEPEPGYGYMLTVCGDDGRDYRYLHLNNDTPGSDDGEGGPEHAYVAGVTDGARVERGQHIAWMGDSGNAEATQAHLHFQIEDPDVTDPYGSNYLNPYRSLVAAEARGDYADAGGAGGGEVVAAGASRPETVTAETVDRVAGSDRVGTAVALSQETFGAAGRVVLAAAQSLPDAAAAGPLAAAAGAPVLTTWRQRLDDRVAQEVRRLGATRVTLVGGPLALSEQVAADLVTEAGVEEVERVAGGDAPATAAAVARVLWAAGGPRRATVALGVAGDATGSPDALGSGWHGAVTGSPVLLTLPGRLPPSTADALDGVEQAVIVGGTAAVPEDVAAQIAQRARSTRRLAGADRYATATAVASDLLDAGASPQRVWVAGGAAWADALAAGPAVARAGETFLLVDGTAAGGDGAVDAWLRERADAVQAGRVVGGTAAVSDAAARLLAERIG